MTYKLSIMICNYNDSWCIENALNSIPKRNDIQIIIVDDCSTDNSDTVIRNYIQNNPVFNYKYIKNNKNIGLGLSRKVASEFIEGEYFTVLDCDDFYYTNELNNIIDNYLNKNHDIVYFNLERVESLPVAANSYNYRRYSGHNKIFKTQFVKNSNLQWHNLRRGSDLDFDRQWWYLKPNMVFTGIIAKKWNRPNERFSNLSMYGAKNLNELKDKTREFMKSDDNNVQIIKTILSNRVNDEFLKTYNPTFEEADYNYDVII